MRTGLTQAAASMISVEVEDTGIGIPEDHLPYIMDRFRQVDSSSTRRYEGTGIGLTIVKESVELMKGRVTVDSTKGRVVPSGWSSPPISKSVPRRRSASGDGVSGAKSGRSVSSNRVTGRRRTRRTDDFVRVAADELALMEKEMLASGEREAKRPPVRSSQVPPRTVCCSWRITMTCARTWAECSPGWGTR